MKYVWSAINNAFFEKDQLERFISAGWLLNDIVDVGDELFNEFVNPPTGKVRVAKKGFPAWADIPQPSQEELIAYAEQQKQQRIDEALQSVSVIQLKLQAGRKLTGEEALRLNQTLDYIDEVEATDTSTAPDISWPVRPA
ncbi:tail fiber assembly protein [Citrobacter freundii]|uniref:tail fiber assembly protein n=1 Tax=Citrobacter freundii complex TaxID=1344959 RepID=UPI001A2FA131|nr:tail fiber assembly protein [Citrobacter freundii]MCW1446120.1 tail fiber assembly protein [Citrobacter freundii]HAT3689742.1 tail fiber assembly protein [Citrobacter freundii]